METAPQISASRAAAMRILSQAGPIMGLALVIILFTVLQPGEFFNYENAQFILKNTVVVATAALGMTIVIVGGGIDLSVGSTVALSAVVIALVLNEATALCVKMGLSHDSAVLWASFAAIGAGLGTATVAGVINGMLITYLKLLPFIVTLGTMAIYRGLALKLADQSKINGERCWYVNVLRTVDSPAEGWQVILHPHHWLGLLPAGVWVTLLLAIIVALWLRYTRVGRHVYAIGSNEQTARLCGIHVERVKILTYALLGLFVGIAALLHVSRSNCVGNSTEAEGMELNVIAAVVIGGASLTGGQGTILGTVVGALIMSVLDNGLVAVGMKQPEQKMIIGAIVILAVTLDRLQHRTRKN